MDKINSSEELNSRIFLLEMKQAQEVILLKQQCLITYEALKPVNLIKNTLHDLAKAPDLKGDLLDATMSIASGYISKKIAVGNTHNPIKKVLGLVLQMAVTNIVSKNADGIKSSIALLINKLSPKEETNE